jgi:hypothetical protein
MQGAKPWYASTTIQGAIIQLFVFADLAFKFQIGTEAINEWITGIFGVIGLTMVIYGRIKAKYVIE